MTDPYGQSLDLTFCLREPALRQSIASLGLAPGSHGLDAGCGIGLQSIMLAEAVAPGGRVTGLDLQQNLLRAAHDRIAEADLQDRISFQVGDITHIPFDDDSFDWVWSSDCVGYGPWDTPAILAEVRRVLRPCGNVALVLWSSEQLLPGHPELEARLKGTSPGMAPFATEMGPRNHPCRLLGPLREAGFIDCRADAFAGSAHAPLTDDLRAALVDLFEMRWPGVDKELSDAERADFKRFCNPASPDFVVDLPEYYALFTPSLFRGTVPG